MVTGDPAVDMSGPFITTNGHAPLVQILNGHEVWRKCTPKQRELLRGLRVEINADRKLTNERYAVRNVIEAPPRTLASLAAKGVCDDRGHITLLGAYGALWGPTRDEVSQ